MKQINGHALTIPANSGASQILFTMSLMILTLFPLTLLSDSSKLSQQNVDPTVFTVPGPYHILKMPSKSQLSRSHTTVFHFSGNNTITQSTHTKTKHQRFYLISFLVSLALSVLELKMKQNLLPATHISLLATDTMM